MNRTVKNSGKNSESTEDVRLARTDAEREAIFRLRYEVLVEQLRQSRPDADRATRTVHTAADNSPDTQLLYVGSAESINATLSLTSHAAGQATPSFAERFGLKLFSDGKTVPVGEISEIVISPRARRGFSLQALMRTAFLMLARDKGARYIFLQSPPSLLTAFRRLGFRPYAAEIDFASDGIKVPMVLVSTDLEHLSGVKSPLLGLAREIVALKSRVDSHSAGASELEPRLELEEDIVWHEMQQALLQADVISGSFMDGLSQKAVSYLSDKGFIVSIAENRVLVREDTVEEEMFVLLEGLFEVTHEGKRVALLGKGDLCGELAFFLESQQRTATVTSLSDGRVMIIKRKFLKELAQTDPELCSELLFKICQTLARRLAGTL